MDRTVILRGAIPCTFAAILVLGAAWQVFGEIVSGTNFAIVLTDSKEANKKAKWSDPERISVTPDGLGWGKSANEGSRDFWLETTEPIGIGLSWRPASSASIRARVEQTAAPGLLYVRYSADARHWSTWQPLEASEAAATHEYRGNVRVPYRENARYHELRMEYSRRKDVPWSSDEEALVREILKQEPRFLEESIPFIGYVQFLFEAQLPGGSRIKKLEVDINWVLGGRHHSPKEEKDSKDRDGPWRLKAP